MQERHAQWLEQLKFACKREQVLRQGSPEQVDLPEPPSLEAARRLLERAIEARSIDLGLEGFEQDAEHIIWEFGAEGKDSE
jgi:hypothetical protein